MDFSENFSFNIQDEAQGTQRLFHAPCHLLLQKQCWKIDNYHSGTVIIYLVQCKTTHFLKDLIQELKFVEYFSDGCATPHKNKKMLL